jgi:uncharacterized protein (DUF1810 family)
VDDPYRLERFVDAQNRGGSYSRALAEVQRGGKESHWIWYVFPQIAGLASSSMSREFAISSLEEARLYLRHPVLGPRLLEITAAANAHPEKSAAEIFGPDDVKFRSSMTLFMRAQTGPSLFYDALVLFFDGEPDAKTDAILRAIT